MIYLQKVVIDQNRRSQSSIEKAKFRCGMTDLTLVYYEPQLRVAGAHNNAGKKLHALPRSAPQQRGRHDASLFHS